MTEEGLITKIGQPYVFIPAQNEEKTIAKVVGDVRKNLEEAINQRVVVVVGDDGSVDGTRKEALAAGAIVLHHPEPIGLGTNFRRGVEFAIEHGADLLLTIDADGQFDTKEVGKLVSPIQRGVADFVSGSRFLPESKVDGISALKRWGNHRVSGIINAITGKHFSDVSCGYRAYNKEALLRLNLFGGFTYTHEVFLALAYQGLRVIEVPITVQYFPERTSRIAGSIMRYGWNTSKIIFKSLIYYRPMWLMAQLALAQMIPGLLLLVSLGVRFIFTGAITPYKYLMIIGVLLCVSATATLVVGLFLQLYSRIQHNLDTILYYEKRKRI